MESAVLWGITRRRVVIVYRHIGTTYWSQEDHRFHQHRGGGLKSGLNGLQTSC
jgi:hypothetical protein